MSVKVEGSRVYCFDPKFEKYRLMGTIKGDIFIKKVKANNYMRVVDGYGLQYDAFYSLPDFGVKKILVEEQHTGNEWIVDWKDWEEHSKAADYGNGKQVFLSLKYMKQVKHGLKKPVHEIDDTASRKNTEDAQ